MTDQKTIDRIASTPAGPQWQRIGIKNHHGIALPLFSLHSANSCGIGEFPDLIPLIDWCGKTGFDVIQLLPLNDTGHETSPYSALSAFALNPLHLGLASLPFIDEDQALAAAVQKLQAFSRQCERVDYPALHAAREPLLKEYFQRFGSRITTTDNYRAFVGANTDWLDPYSLFKSLKSRFAWKSWEEWPEKYRTPNPEIDVDQSDLEYHRFIQYLCFTQFAAIKQYADQHGVLLKGDIPILINRDSADVWHHREFFRLDLAAGAPPDMYSKEGQKWGFPLYKWEALAQDNYRWWIGRLALASVFYHLYRIDHVVGFFRIWGIPIDLPAKKGRFIPEEERTWIPHGETIMKQMLARCSMLPIGEDLGTVPPEVRRCLLSLGICGTKVLRWERDWHGDKKYLNPKNFPPESMTTVSTHDSETLTQWWSNQSNEARLYCMQQGWKYSPVLSPEQRLAILRASHQSGSLFHINLLQEYLATVPGMVHDRPEEERINVPGIISKTNWTYRLKPSVEQILAAADKLELSRFS